MDVPSVLDEPVLEYAERNLVVEELREPLPDLRTTNHDVPYCTRFRVANETEIQ